MPDISAKVIAHSHNGRGNEIITFELEYPRIIHSELMTHRLFSRNAASSRAIPVKTLIEMVRKEPAMPYRFGANQPGMQDKGVEHDGIVGAGYTGREWWNLAALSAARFAEELAEAGYHKQIANRLLEPFQRMKTVLTATEYENFWWLRVDADADPTIEALAIAMHKEYEASEPELLQPGQWHTPYVEHFYENIGLEGDDVWVFCGYYVEDENGEKVILDAEEAKAISSSCCAQVSYRRLNSTKDKALDIYGRLLTGRKVHASPFEHIATPMLVVDSSTGEDVFATLNRYEGYTHVDKHGNFWSANFKGWVQYRQLLDNHTKW
ncbi:thymidylate synthase [Klebsiella phage phi1_175008]|uniref:Thymidylate synthase n=2 Tax=Klebsiella phage phi1_175008 TaxID=3127744 RepID=A0ACD5FRS9_9CAUD